MKLKLFKINKFNKICIIFRNSLKKVQQVSNTERPKGIDYIEDDEILGNSDKMLFYSKELESSATDNNYEYNPFLIGKLELESI